MGDYMNSEMVELFSKLVYSVARKYSYSNEDLEDLYQVGIIGLQNAMKNYNSDSDAKFSTYAHFYIKGEILKYIRENRAIKINYDTDKLIRSIAKVKEYLTQVNSRSPSIEEIASFLELDVSDIIDAINVTQSVKSLDYELTDEGKEVNLYDYQPYVEKGYDEDILMLRDEIDKLSPIEQKIIKSRYYEDKSQSEISKELGISQVQVSRNEGKILSKLRVNLVKENA